MVGILMGYLTSYLLISEVGGWRSMFGVSVFPAIVLGSGMVSSLHVLLGPIAPKLLVCRQNFGVRPLEGHRELLELDSKSLVSRTTE